VFLAGGLASTAASVVVALVVLALEGVVGTKREQDRLIEAARTLAVELDEPDADVAWVIGDETRELAGSGIDIAVFDGDRHLGGETLERAPDGCIATAARRTCEVRGARWIAVASRLRTTEYESRDALMIALGMSVAVAAALSALLGWLAARWSLRPLLGLTARVEGTRDDEENVDLGPREGIAEVDALRAALETTLARLKIALDHSRRFAGDAAHELRTPLTAIAGELELLAEVRAEPDDVESIARTRRVVARLASLVERLLVLAIPQRDREALEDVQLDECIEDRVAELAPAQRSRVTLTLMTDTPRLAGDASLLTAMVSAGLENALKFSEGPVQLSLSQRGAALVVTIDDSGPGVASVDRERLFRPFERASSAPGHGIGLALVAHVAALHRGKVAFVDGAPGARLEITLPKG
jgi:signal transduction histidine kinase